MFVRKLTAEMCSVLDHLQPPAKLRHKDSTFKRWRPSTREERDLLIAAIKRLLQMRLVKPRQNGCLTITEAGRNWRALQSNQRCQSPDCQGSLAS